jgi:hypothetical protein
MHEGEEMTDCIVTLELALQKPIAKTHDDRYVEHFDPWEDLFPMFYGCYSGEFDEMAIRVLENIDLSVRGSEETLAHEMFREVLCNAGYCDYGVSPRVCFATREFSDLLPELIEKWKLYSKYYWSREE